MDRRALTWTFLLVITAQTVVMETVAVPTAELMGSLIEAARRDVDVEIVLTIW